jgi:hypothetical protein
MRMPPSDGHTVALRQRALAQPSDQRWTGRVLPTPTIVPCDERAISDTMYRRVLQAYAPREHGAHGGTTEPVAAIDEVSNDLSARRGSWRR